MPEGLLLHVQRQLLEVLVRAAAQAPHLQQQQPPHAGALAPRVVEEEVPARRAAPEPPAQGHARAAW
eukprot:15451149-Alexandrium_andersonii.AAC.1